MKKQDKIRYSILILFLILFTIFSIRHYVFGGKVAASVDALCPFGGFETLYTFIVTGSFVPRILMSSLILAVGILITTLILRRGFCGYICPFGTVQELIGRVKKKKPKLPKSIDKEARMIKYFILTAILIGTAFTGTLVWRNFDPFVTFFHFGKGVLWSIEKADLFWHVVPFIITLIVLFASFFIPRFFCRYICPLGATMNIFARFGFTKIHRKSSCIDCKKCDKVCPTKVKVSNVDYVRDLECINCNQCVSVCPKKSLDIRILGKSISVMTYIFLLVVLFFSVIAVSKAVGIWQSVPSSADITAPSGELNSEYIKGWMTFEDISKEIGVTVEKMRSDLSIPNSVPLGTPFREIKNYIPGWETYLVRNYVDNLNTPKNTQADCPWEETDCKAPGKCGAYTDSDNDGLCDHGY